MERIEIERYIDNEITKAKKEMRENILTDVADIIVKASHKINKNTSQQDILEALRYQVENKLRMDE
jgi:hypothetical protein